MVAANQHECIIFEVDASLFQSSSSSTQPRLYHHCHFSTSPSTTIPASQATEAPSRQQQTSYHHHSFSAPLELSISTTCLPAAPRLPQAAAWLESPLPPPASAAAAPTTRNHNYASTSPMNFSARRSQVVTRQAPRSVAIPVQ